MIGSRLRRMRLAKGMTQRELASPNYTHAYVSTIEAGRRKPSREAVEYFAAKLGVGADELLTGRPPDLAAKLELRLQEARHTLSGGRIEEASEALRAIAREGKRFGLPRIEAKAEEGLGLGLERLGRPEGALTHYERAEKILKKEAPTALVDAVAGKARCLHSLGDVRYAIHVLESLLGELTRQKLHDPDALTRVHAGLVYSYLDAGLYSKAAESASELDQLAPSLKNPLRIAQMHMTVARLYLVQGRVEDARRSLQHAEDAYRLVDLKAEIGAAHLARGYVLSREGKLSESREQLEKARAIFEETNDQDNLIRTLPELARVERLEGSFNRAQVLLERSIALMGESDTPVLAWTHRELGLTLAESNPRVAEKHFRAAIDLYERVKQAVDIAVTYRALGDLLRFRGEHEAGFEAYRTGILALEAHL